MTILISAHAVSAVRLLEYGRSLASTCAVAESQEFILSVAWTPRFEFAWTFGSAIWPGRALDVKSDGMDPPAFLSAEAAG